MRAAEMGRIRYVLCVLILMAAVSHAPARDLPQATPESVGLSSERLRRISAAVEGQIEANRIAGAVTLVARKGQVAWLKAHGSMDKEAGKAMRPDTIFRIASMTKPITSTAIMILYEEGRLMLNDPVSTYIPEFKNPQVLVKQPSGRTYTIPAEREITIRHLLTHTAGLTYHWNPDLGKIYQEAGVPHGLQQYDGTVADGVRKLAALPLLFHPGERFEYGVNIDVLGYLVEVVSGMPLDEFFHSRIFDPLGMRDTYFYLPEEKLDRLAVAYTWSPEKGLQRFPEESVTEGALSYSADYPYRGPKKLFAGGAGLASTAEDYARFAQMILNKGTLNGTRILSRKSVELMTQDQLGKVNEDFGFGLGFSVVGVKGPLRELGSVGAGGWGGFWYTLFLVDPKEEMVVVFMAQLHPDGGLNLNHLFTVLAYQAIVD